MTITVLFYGNCQLFACLRTLNLPPTYKTILVECWNNDIDKKWFTDIICNCDIIITQPINDTYKDVDYLSTSYLIKHKSSLCKLIIMDSCYFNFYYFDLAYKTIQGELLREPIDYHYNKMIECYCEDKSANYYLNNFVNNVDYKTSDELASIAKNGLDELKRRRDDIKNKYPSVDYISTCDFIEQNYKNKLLFYSMNHPTNVLIQFICSEIVKILNISDTIDYNIDMLNTPKCMIYKCISKHVNFDLYHHKDCTKNTNTEEEITKLYYDSYALHENKIKLLYNK